MTTAAPARALQPDAAPDAAEPRTITIPGSATAQRLFLFYLVATAEQAQIADWDEATSFLEGGARSGSPDRTYQILYARDPEEKRLAAEAILDTMLAFGRGALVQVIDLRPVNAGP
jgi:hypothetical protein